VVFSDDYDPMLLRAISAQDADQSPLAAVRAAVRGAFAQIYDADHDTIYERTRLVLTTPALRSKVFESTRETERVFGAAVAERLGLEPRDLPVRVFMAVTFAAMMTAIDAWVEGGGKSHLPALIDEALALLESDLDLRPRR
jgi:hypothetical protein